MAGERTVKQRTLCTRRATRLRPSPAKETAVSPVRESSVKSQRSGDRARLAQHLGDVGAVVGLGGDLLTGVFLQHDVAALDEAEQPVVLREALLLVHQRLAQDLVDVVLVGLE